MKKSIFLVCLVVFGVVSLSAIGPIVSVSRLGWQTDSISYGISRMVDIASLPLLDRGISVHYEGSIDKRGRADHLNSYSDVVQDYKYIPDHQHQI